MNAKAVLVIIALAAAAVIFWHEKPVLEKAQQDFQAYQRRSLLP